MRHSPVSKPRPRAPRRSERLSVAAIIRRDNPGLNEDAVLRKARAIHRQMRGAS